MLRCLASVLPCDIRHTDVRQHQFVRVCLEVIVWPVASLKTATVTCFGGWGGIASCSLGLPVLNLFVVGLEALLHFGVDAVSCRSERNVDFWL